MRLFVSIVLALGFMACTSNSNIGPVCCAPPHADMPFSVVDSQGEDRLDPNHSHPLTEQNIDSYYLKAEDKRANAGINIYQSTDPDIFILELVLSNYIRSNGNTTTLLEFPDGSVDTVSMEPVSEDANSAEKLWYDGELIWEADSDYAMPIKITKSVAENTKQIW